MNLSDYRKIQKFLLASFCVSVAGLFFTGFVASLPMNSQATNGVTPANHSSPTPTATPANVTNSVNTTPNNNPNSNVSADKQPETIGYGLSIITGVTLVTSLTSLLGFLSTTVLAWRKEKRDSAALLFDNEKKELELEKLRLELEKMKTEEKESKEKESKPKRPRKSKKNE